MEKLINMESQLLFQIERKISELPKQTNPLTKIQVESLINAIAKLEDERNLSKVGFQFDSCSLYLIGWEKTFWNPI